MGFNYNLAYPAVYSTLEVKLEIYPHAGLREQNPHEPWCEFGVHVSGELSAFVHVSEEVACDGENGAGRLYRYVPFRPYYA